jgi:hypothetical protein
VVFAEPAKLLNIARMSMFHDAKVGGWEIGSAEAVNLCAQKTEKKLPCAD